MTSLLYESIAAFNAHGVRFLQEERPREALARFQGGLTALLQGLFPQGDDSTPLTETLTGSAGAPTTTSCNNNSVFPPHAVGHNSLHDDIEKARQDIHAISTAEVKRTSGSKKEGDIDAFMVFSRALLLPAESEDCSFLEKGQDYCCKLISAVLTYNVGLTHHLEGLRKGSSTLLNEALDFYSLAYASIVNLPCLAGNDEDDATATSESGLALLSFLAMLNNAGHIHVYFRGFETAKLYVNEISYQLRKHKLIATSFLEVVDYGLFFLNALFYEKFPPRSAPAA